VKKCGITDTGENYGLATSATLQYNGQEKHGLPNVDKERAGDQGFV
jgi:hypothetical protein